MAQPTLRVGFIGAGGIVRQRHVPGLRKAAGVELYGVVNRSRESTERAAEEYGIAHRYDTWQQLVADPNVDIVWIGTWPSMHRELTIAALDAGKHVFCQARMAMDAADARKMYDRAQQSDRTVMICPPPHYMEGDRLVRRLIGEGFLGDLRAMIVRSFNGSFADADKPLHWREIGAISGLNTMDVGMMSEVTTRWVGPAKRVAAMAHTAYPTRPTESGGRGQVDRPDTVSVTAEMERGGMGTFMVSTVVHHTSPNSIELYGSAGTIKYVMGADHIMAGKANGQLERVGISAEEWRHWTAEQDFVDAVRAGKRNPEPSFDDGVKYMRFTEAVFRAASTGQTVNV